MNKIEALAFDLALLSNDSLGQLAEVLVRDYPTRVDSIETALKSAVQEQTLKLYQDLGLTVNA